MQTRVFKDRDGWNAETMVDLEGNRVLKIKTYRNLHHKLVTTASVWHCDGSGTMRHAFGFGSGGDFDETLIVANVPRVTSSVVEGQHGRAIAAMQSIQDRVAAHYTIDINAKACADARALGAPADAHLEDSHVPG